MHIALAFGIASMALSTGCSSAPSGSAGPVAYAAPVGASGGYSGGYQGYSAAPVPTTPEAIAESGVPPVAAEPTYAAPLPLPLPRAVTSRRIASGNATSDAFLPPPEIRGGLFHPPVVAAPASPPPASRVQVDPYSLPAPIVASAPVITQAPRPSIRPAIRPYRPVASAPAMRVGRPAPVVRKAAGPDCPT